MKNTLPVGSPSIEGNLKIVLKKSIKQIFFIISA